MPVRCIELVLEHDGDDWLVHGHGIEARGATLTALDRALAGSLAHADLPADPLIVHMRFNRRSLPHWVRQYTSHYFNRTIRLSPSPPESLS